MFFFFRNLGLAWESVTPITHIWEKSPPKKLFSVVGGGLPLPDPVLEMLAHLKSDITDHSHRCCVFFSAFVLLRKYPI